MADTEISKISAKIRSYYDISYRIQLSAISTSGVVLRNVIFIFLDFFIHFNLFPSSILRSITYEFSKISGFDGIRSSQLNQYITPHASFAKNSLSLTSHHRPSIAENPVTEIYHFLFSVYFIHQFCLDQVN